MRGQRGWKFFEQDKGVLRLLRNLVSNQAEMRSTRKSQYSAISVRRWPLLAVVIWVSVVWMAWSWDLHVNVSRSAPRGLYRAANAPLTRGALVAACLPTEVARVGLERGYLPPGSCPGGAQPVIKRVAAMASDAVDVTSTRVSVNGRPLSDSAVAAADSRGRALSHMPWGERMLSDGEVWLMGTADRRSWDSRYFGPVTAAAIRTVVRPVFTID